MEQLNHSKLKFFKRGKRQPSFIKIFALGGLGEIGKNMYGIEFKEEIIIIDAGLKFPDSDMPGIDYIIPDMQYLIMNKEKIKGLFLTHGHEDHIGAVPYLLRQLRIPVYGAALTIALVRAKLEEHRLLNEANLHVINLGTPVVLRHLQVEFIRTSHSIPDACALAVKTPHGYVVHSGDFKFDLTPSDLPPDLQRLAYIGQQGVLALLSDSTNSERPGHTPSETVIGTSILDLFEKCKGRILLSTFASNVHRLQQVVEAAIACNRKLIVLGRSMERVFAIGQELGYIRVPDGMIVDHRSMDAYPLEQIVVICTGSQGEPQAALTRMAFGSHRLIQICPDDTVIFSSSPIPGNVKSVNRSIDLLLRAGAHVIYGSSLDIHTSGHGSQEDLKLMLRLTKPQYFIPIHGEYRMQIHHANLAEKTGVPRSHIHILDNGDLISLNPKQAKLEEKIPHGVKLVSNNAVSNMTPELLNDRIMLGNNGIVIVVISVRKDNYTLLSAPTIISRGFVYIRDAGPLLDEAERIVTDLLSSIGHSPSKSYLSACIANTLKTYFSHKLERSPYVLPVIMEV